MIQGDPNQKLQLQMPIAKSFFDQFGKFLYQNWFEEWRFFVVKVSFAKLSKKIKIFGKSTS